MHCPTSQTEAVNVCFFVKNIRGEQRLQHASLVPLFICRLLRNGTRMRPRTSFLGVHVYTPILLRTHRRDTLRRRAPIFFYFLRQLYSKDLYVLHTVRVLYAYCTHTVWTALNCSLSFWNWMIFWLKWSLSFLNIVQCMISTPCFMLKFSNICTRVVNFHNRGSLHHALPLAHNAVTPSVTDVTFMCSPVHSTFHSCADSVNMFPPSASLAHHSLRIQNSLIIHKPPNTKLHNSVSRSCE